MGNREKRGGKLPHRQAKMAHLTALAGAAYFAVLRQTFVAKAVKVAVITIEEMAAFADGGRGGLVFSQKGMQKCL